MFTSYFEMHFKDILKSHVQRTCLVIEGELGEEKALQVAAKKRWVTPSEISFEKGHHFVN